jgi:hypothetical protein
MRAVASTRALYAAGFGVLLLLSGCGGDDSPSAAADDKHESPLAEYYEKLFPEQSSEDQDAMMRETEAAVAACMQEAGFEYIPRDPATDGSGAAAPLESDEEYGTEEYAAVHGYDITTFDPEAQPVTEEMVDPNEEYISSLSESAATAYYEALYGAMSSEEYDPEAEPPAYDWTTAGCQGQAEHEVGAGDVYTDPAFMSFQEDTQALYEKAQKSPKTAALNAKWADCMADAGYADYRTPEDAMNDISERANALYENLSESNPVPDEAAMDELREIELDTAVADYRCQEKIDYADTVQSIMAEFEQEYVDTHRAELDALVADLGGGS